LLALSDHRHNTEFVAADPANPVGPNGGKVTLDTTTFPLADAAE
jgi:hypothetical protein